MISYLSIYLSSIYLVFEICQNYPSHCGSENIIYSSSRFCVEPELGIELGESNIWEKWNVKSKGKMVEWVMMLYDLRLLSMVLFLEFKNLS